MTMSFYLVLMGGAWLALSVLAPFAANPGGVAAAALIAALTAFAVSAAQAYLHLWPEPATMPILGVVMVAVFLCAWRVIGGPGPRRFRDLRPPARTDGLPTGLSLQLHVAAAVLFAALVAVVQVLVSQPPQWHVTEVRTVGDVLVPVYIVLACTVALVVGAEIVRVRAGMTVTGEALPLHQAFAVHVWRWGFVTAVGLMFGLAASVGGTWHHLYPAVLIPVFVVIAIAVPALCLVTARPLERWTGASLLQVRPRGTRPAAPSPRG